MGTKIQRAVGVGAPFIYVFPLPVIEQRSPGITDVNYPLGQVWINNSTLPAIDFVYLGAGTWSSSSGASFSTLTVSGLSTLAAVTQAGVANINTTGAATTNIGTGGTGVVNIGNTTGTTFVFGLLTAGSGITATTGNLSLLGVGSGLVLTPTVVAAGASPQTANGRVGVVTFSSVSIAAGATQAFTISNTAITGSGTQLLLSMVGATSGAALNIQSVANTASQTVITVENGTGATTSIANITFTYIVLN
jgi:hypothetical protein